MGYKHTRRDDVPLPLDVADLRSATSSTITPQIAHRASRTSLQHCLSDGAGRDLLRHINHRLTILRPSFNHI